MRNSSRHLSLPRGVMLTKPIQGTDALSSLATRHTGVLLSVLNTATQGAHVLPDICSASIMQSGPSSPISSRDHQH